MYIYDANGNLFDDASSLQIDWFIDDANVAQLKQKETLFEPRDFDYSKKQNGGTQGVYLDSLLYILG